jgi:DNA repair protein RadD
MITLRDYQSDMVAQVRDAYRSGCRAPLVVSPTGSGKTVLFAFIASQARSKSMRAMILVHRQELLDQTARTLDSLDVPHGVIAAGRTQSLRELVQVAGVQTVVRRVSSIQPPDLIIVDEAHHATAGSWQKVIEAFPGALILGVTATPERLDGKGLGIDYGGTFDALIRGPEVRDLIRRGFLAPPVYYSPPTRADFSGVAIRRGDYDARQLSAAVDKPSITGDAVDHYRRICPGVPAVAFCVSIAHAHHVADEFRRAGFRAATLDGTITSDERRDRVRALGDGRLHVMTSCEIINEGFDLPVVGAAILLRPTKSLGLHLQQIGRVLRPAPGKTRAVVLDHVGNLHEHGLAEDVREWTLEGKKARLRKAKAEHVVKTRQCPSCYAVHLWGPSCDECGHEYIATVRELQQVDGILTTHGNIVDEKHHQCAGCNHVHSRWDPSCPRCGHVHDPVRARKKEQSRAQTYDELVQIARRRGYKNPAIWARHVWQSRQSKRSSVHT